MKKMRFLFSALLAGLLLFGVSCGNELTERYSSSDESSILEREAGSVTASIFVMDWQKMSESARVIAPQTATVSLLYKIGTSWSKPITLVFDKTKLESIPNANENMPGGIWRGTFGGIPSGEYAAGDLKVCLYDGSGTEITSGVNEKSVAIVAGESASGEFFTIPDANLIKSEGSLKKSEMGFWKQTIYSGYDYTFTITATPSYPDVVLFDEKGVYQKYYPIDSAKDAKISLPVEKNTLYYFGLYADDGEVTSYEITSTGGPSIGFVHPENGAYSLVEVSKWSDATKNLKGGAVLENGNMCVSVYSANAEKILLEIYEKPYGEDAKYDYWLEKGADNWWRAEIAQASANTLYAFRAWGPNWTFDKNWTRGSSAGFESDCDANGNRFNPNKVLYDPYAREMTHDVSNAKALQGKESKIMTSGEENRNEDSGRYAPKGILIVDGTSTGAKPYIPQEDAIIYEAHVRGLTKHSSSASLSSILEGIDGFENVQNIPSDIAGTYKAAGMMAPYLKGLGINTIELLPVHETDNDCNPDDNPGGNYWGYMTYNYFAPDRRYSSDKDFGGPTKEFKEMVKAFHEAGMEVYLDVVYNHSGEGGTWQGDKDGNAQCTLVSMRGLDNATYYSLVQDNKSSYWETTGCGNNLQCDNPYVRKFILDSLAYWTDEMGVDGFRFDLATVLGRELNSATGSWDYNDKSETLKQIVSLGNSKNIEMIAESWDTGGGSYQVGNFPAGWGGWNGRYRDALRGYVGGGNRKDVNNYIYGDYDSFSKEGGPHKSVNFIVAHDGFTLADLCSYSGKGNAQNGTLEWPFGPSDGGNGDENATVFGSEKPARRQANRNYSAIQMISRGVPMIVWGDEFCRTQNGNNNPYNIDSVATWNNYNMINTASPHAVATGGAGSYHDNFGTFDNSANRNGNFVFMQYIMNMRANDPALRQNNYSVVYDFKKEDGSSYLSGDDKCVWLKITGSSVDGGHDYLVFMNMHSAAVSFAVPAATDGVWKRVVDTQSYFETDYNCWLPETGATISEKYGVAPYSVVILMRVSSDEVNGVASPVISGDSPFAASTTVEITCKTEGAKIYYTTDGTDPTNKSTEYKSPITISAKTTVKAISVLGDKQSGVVSKIFVKKEALSPVSKSGVMLQGFNWDSAPRSDDKKWGKWYATMTKNASSIKDTFAYVWCPPPSITDTSSSEGYAPTELNVLSNCYGTEADQKEMIKEIKPARAIADIVINHRAGTSAWGNFTNPTFGVDPVAKDYSAICSDDEGFTDSNSEMVGAIKKGAPDTGDGYGAYRDLDHTNLTVQKEIIDWMGGVLLDAGYAGWRYDYVKGYGGEYVGKYNAATSAEFSVGEYWPTAGYVAENSAVWGDAIKGWISATETGGQRSKAFDFALKGALNSIFGTTKGAANSNYGHLADTANLVISQPEDAVTFVDNHDTGSTQKHWTLDSDDIGTAYAFILTHPGVPCVAWQHYFTYAESGSNGTDGGAQYLAGTTVPGTSNTLRQHIDELIKLRNDYGIEFDSERTSVSTTKEHYVADVVGTKGTLRVCIGDGYTPAAGAATELYKGTNFAVWEVNPDYVPQKVKVTLTTKYNTYGNGGIYFTGNFDEGEEWGKAVRGTLTGAEDWSVEVTYNKDETFEWKPIKCNSSDEIISVPSDATWPQKDNAVGPGTTQFAW